MHISQEAIFFALGVVCLFFSIKTLPRLKIRQQDANRDADVYMTVLSAEEKARVLDSKAPVKESDVVSSYSVWTLLGIIAGLLCLGYAAYGFLT